MKVFIGMEASGTVRRAMQERGHYAISCDLLPDANGASSPFGSSIGGHIQGDVFTTLADLKLRGWWPDLGIFHPTCTFLTCSAEWAYGDGPYHQKVKSGTLVGQARRDARERAVADVLRIAALPIARKAIENPRGALSSRWRKPDQTIQPFEFGDDASKATSLWLENLPPLVPTNRILGRLVECNGKMVERWGNQTDGGQNKLTPGPDRWKLRSVTYQGIADAFADQWTKSVSLFDFLGEAA